MGIDLNRFKGKKPSQEWLDWLADDPVPSGIRARIRSHSVRSASRPQPRSSTNSRTSSKSTTQDHPKIDDGNKTVSIHISVPDGKKLKAGINRAKTSIGKYKPNRTVGMGVASLVIIGVGVFAVVAILGDDKTDQPSGDTSVLSKATAKPDFDYSLPKGKEDQVDQAVKFDATKKVVNYVDSIGGVTITVSQQPLPAGFSDNAQDKVRKLAEDYSANHPLTTANPTAYLGTDSKGPQTVIFTKKNLLVFIQSSNRIDDHDWAEYITNLQ